MEFIAIERGPGALQEPLTLDQIHAISERTFGSGATVTSVRELGGGEFNTVYRIGLSGNQSVILRVAPPPTRALPWHEADLMRHEHAIQPYLAPLGPLVPRTLAVDFTRQLIPRDYLIQADMPGEPWNRIGGQLAPEDDDTLWRQLADIARTLHGVAGEAFGHPYPGAQFSTWSETVVTWLEWAARDAAAVQLDTTEIRAIREAACVHAPILDEIERPRLLHGDLWPFNVLVERGADGARIVAVLDCDRVAWGDPLAEWTSHLLPRKASTRARAAFWAAYGARDRSLSARFRDSIYEGLHASNVLSAARRAGQEEALPKVQTTLRAVVKTLRVLPV